MREVRAVGGLCNRLQHVISARAAYGPLLVTWDLQEPALAGARFSDLFEPLDGVEFREHGTAPESCHVCADAPEGWVMGYRDLKPRLEIVDRIRRLVGDYNYAAIHVRRSSGHVELLEHLGVPATTDVELDLFVHEHPDHLVYLATDNADTQTAWLNRCRRTFVNRVIRYGTERQGLGNHAIHTSVADAVVDLYVCAGAAHFMGTRGSSFTDTIERLRALR